MRDIGCLEDTDTLGLDALCVAEMDGGWRVEAETGVAVLVVVPAEEALAEVTIGSLLRLTVLQCAANLQDSAPQAVSRWRGACSSGG